jgi:hypothetical protein
MSDAEILSRCLGIPHYHETEFQDLACRLATVKSE